MNLLKILTDSEECSLYDAQGLCQHLLSGHQGWTCGAWVQLQVRGAQRISIEQVNSLLSVLHSKPKCTQATQFAEENRECLQLHNSKALGRGPSNTKSKQITLHCTLAVSSCLL